MAETLLSINNVSVQYGHARALNNVSLAITAGGITSIVGANGAGKTTLIRAISGMIPVSGGEIVYRGIPLTGRSAFEICELGLTQIPEGRQIFPSLTVEENLRSGALLHRARGRAKSQLQDVFEMFTKLHERRHQAAGTLSGGEQQMLAIGRGLMSNPEFVMLDEPSLGLSPLMTETMFGIVENLTKRYLTVLLIEQNVTESLNISHTGYVLENGTVALRGTGSELLQDERVREAYLGL